MGSKALLNRSSSLLEILGSKYMVRLPLQFYYECQLEEVSERYEPFDTHTAEVEFSVTVIFSKRRDRRTPKR